MELPCQRNIERGNIERYLENAETQVRKRPAGTTRRQFLVTRFRRHTNVGHTPTILYGRVCASLAFKYLSLSLQMDDVHVAIGRRITSVVMSI